MLRTLMPPVPRTHQSWSWGQRLGSSAARNRACGHLAKEGRRFDRNLRVYSPATEYVLMIQHECGGLSIRSRSCLWCYRVVSRMETRISLAKKDKDRELSSYLSPFQRSEFLTRPRFARRAACLLGNRSKWSSRTRVLGMRTWRQEGSAGNAREENAEGKETEAAPAVLARLALVEVAYRAQAFVVCLARRG
jgi:hypothetical protein